VQTIVVLRMVAADTMPVVPERVYYPDGGQPHGVYYQPLR